MIEYGLYEDNRGTEADWQRPPISDDNLILTSLLSRLVMSVGFAKGVSLDEEQHAFRSDGEGVQLGGFCIGGVPRTAAMRVMQGRRKVARDKAPTDTW